VTAQQVPDQLQTRFSLAAAVRRSSSASFSFAARFRSTCGAWLLRAREQVSRRFVLRLMDAPVATNAEAPAGDAPASPRGAYYNKWDRFAETEAAAVKAEEAAEKAAAERCARAWRESSWRRGAASAVRAAARVRFRLALAVLALAASPSHARKRKTQTQTQRAGSQRRCGGDGSEARRAARRQGAVGGQAAAGGAGQGACAARRRPAGALPPRSPRAPQTLRFRGA
jgi:hypothetical protein